MKRSLFSLCAGLACLFALPAAAQQSPCRIPDDPAVVIEILFPVVDTNSNGSISLGEIAAPYPEITQPIFDLVDSNHDGKITKPELLFALTLVPVAYGPYIDPNDDGVIYFSEVDEYLTRTQFDAIDLDNNGRIDCGDFGGNTTEGEAEEGELEEGELEEGELEEGETLPCPLPQDPHVLIDFLWPVIDADASGGLSLAEVQAITDIVTQSIFDIADTNADGEVSRDELTPFIPLIPVDFLSYIDTNADGLIGVYEVLNYTDAGVFFALDRNGNSFLDCGDLGDDPREGEIEPEGEPEGEGDPALDLCAYVPYFEMGFDFADTDADGQLTLAEIEAALAILALPLPDLAPYFAQIDTDNSGGISREEVAHVVANCGGTGEGEGQIEPEGEGDPNLDLCANVHFFQAGFGIADTDNNGQVTLIEIEAILAQLGMPLPDLTVYFAQFDADASGGISQEEVDRIVAYCNGSEGEGEGGWVDPCTFLYLYGADAYPLYDADGDFRLSFEELPVINFFDTPDVSPEQAFALADFNADAYIDDYEFTQLRANCGFGWEGEGEVDPCGLIGFYGTDFSLYDTNNDGNISFEELPPVYIIAIWPVPPGFDVQAMFNAANYREDTVLDQGEIADLLARCGFEGDPTEGELPEGEFEGEPGEGDALAFLRSVAGNGLYAPGDEITITIELHNLTGANITALGISETLPAGWAIGQVLETAGATAAPLPGDTGTVDFAWLDMPAFPVHVAYTLIAPGDASGTQIIVGEARYRIGTENFERSVAATTALGQGDGPEWCHDADQNRDWTISLSEALRLIQLYNSTGYHCEAGTEDGFAPGPGDTTCAPHATDYLTRDWAIDLSELLRLVQIYNSRGYYLQEGTEDGYAPGTFQQD